MKAISPISHYSDERAGNIAMLRRFAIIHDNQRVEVPVISGNSLRGQLRRVAARRTMELAGIDRLKTPAWHGLFSGGALVAGKSDHAHRVADIQRLRDVVPMVALFGASLSTEIIPGNLRSDIVWPVCAETAAITGIPASMSCNEMIQSIFYTRRDDGRLEVAEGDQHTSDQMIFEGEAIAAGAELVGGLHLVRATTLAAGCLMDALSHWQKTATLGGMGSRGHGRVAVEIDLDAELAATYRQHMSEHADQVGELLEAWQ